MVAGFQVFNNSNTIQITSETINLGFYAKGSIATVAPQARYQVTPTLYLGDKCTSKATYANSSFPVGGVFAFSCASRIAALNIYTPRTSSNPSFSLACNGPIGTIIDWWYFAPMSGITPSSSGAGMQIFDSSGNLAYDSNYHPIKFIDFLSADQNTATSWKQGYAGTRTYPSGRTYAMAHANACNLRATQVITGSWKDLDTMAVMGYISGNSITFEPQIGSINSSVFTPLSEYWQYNDWGVMVLDVTGL